MLEPCNFPSLQSCQKRFLRAHKEVDLAPHSVVGLVFQAGDTEKFPLALRLESLDLSLGITKRIPYLKVIKENGSDKGLVQLKLACEADDVAHYIIRISGLAGAVFARGCSQVPGTGHLL